MTGAMIWEPDFVGRDKELKLLLENLERTRNGHGNIIFITGEAGVGKTRLAKELSNQKTAFEFEFLTGTCIYNEGIDPYLPFIDMFKTYLSGHPYLAHAIQASFKAPVSEIFDFFPIEESRYSSEAVSGQSFQPAEEAKKDSSNDSVVKPSGPYLSSVTSSPGIETGLLPIDFFDFQLVEGKHRMFETISRIIIGISKKKPLVLFVDDVHWADSASLHLLHYLARNIQTQPILILCAYRTEELDLSLGQVNPLQEFITRLGSENLFSTIELGRFDHKHTTEIISNLLEVKNIPDEFAKLIYNETEGNPFFIKEVLRTLIEDGALYIEDEKLKLKISPDEMVIPISIKELIHLRLQRLDEVSVDVLEYASVIGNEFPLELLNNIIDMPESKLVNVLSKLTEAKFIEDLKKEDSFVFQFTHNKIHEVIYNSINSVKKKVIHLRLAKYLEDSKIDNIDEVVYDLAHHFYNGLDFDRALSYSIEGGEKAMRTYANKEALDLYNIALNSLRRLDEKLANTTHYKEKKIEVLSKLGSLNKTMGDWDKALNYYENVLPICDEISDSHKKASTYLEIGWIYQQRSFWTEAHNYFNKSLAIAEEINDKQIVGEAYNGLGAVSERGGDFDKALEYYSISRQFAEKNQDMGNLAKAHNAFGRIYNLQGDFTKATKHKETSIYIFEKLNDLPELAKAYTSLGLTYFDMGKLEKNIEYNEKCIELADQISDIRIKGYGLSNSVDALVKTEQLDKAEEYTSTALEIFKKLEERYMIAVNYANFGIINKQRKEWNKAKYYFKIAIELMENLNVPFHLSECYQHFAEVFDKKGESAKAKYYMTKASEIRKSLTGSEAEVSDQRLERVRERRF